MIRRLLTFAIPLVLCASGMAQIKLAPGIIYGTQDVKFEEGNSYGMTKRSATLFGINVDIYDFMSDDFALKAGVGYHWVWESGNDDEEVLVPLGKITTLPLWVGLRYGETIYIEADLGYEIPINSTGYGFISGCFLKTSLGLDFDGFTLGTYLNWISVFGDSHPSFVPDVYMPASGGIGIGVSATIMI